jgi:heme/copper-type cytochrome/quinol oxidase subunit 2
MYKKSSSIYLFLLNYLGINVNEGQEIIVNFIMSIASLSLLGLLCIINIVIYLIIIYFINKYRDSSLNEKYPKLN